MVTIVNPYIAGAPVAEAKMFFGREDIFAWIERSLTGQYVDNILVIHGQRRVGKTSILKQLPNRLPDRYIPVFLDLQGRTHTSLDRFLWWMGREIGRVLKKDHGIEVQIPEREAFTDDPEKFESQFLPELREAISGRVLLLTFDEFDMLEEAGAKAGLAQPLVTTLRRLMGTAGLTFIYSIGSSGRKLENMQAAYTDFFKAALYKKVSFLEKVEAFRLITEPVAGAMEYDPQAVERIYQITFGHPYFTQLLCHELFSRCQKNDERRIAPSDVEAVLDDVVERGTVNLKFVWDEADDLQKWALAALAQNEGRVEARGLADTLHRQGVRFVDQELNAALLHLQEKDVLKPDYTFVVHLMRIWLQKNRPLERVRDELVQVNPIASRYLEIGQEHRELGQVEQAIESFQQALKFDPSNRQARLGIAEIYLVQGTYSQSATEFEKILGQEEDDVAAQAGLCQAYMGLGDSALAGGQPAAAIPWFEKVLAINPEHEAGRGRIAAIYSEQAEQDLAAQRDEHALQAFRQALRYTPDDEALNGRYQEAQVLILERSVQRLLGQAEQKRLARDWEGALKALAGALELQPGRPDLEDRIKAVREEKRQVALNSLKEQARGHAKLEHWEQAAGAWEGALEIEPGDPEAAEGLEQARRMARLEADYQAARKALRGRQYGEAIRSLKKVIDEDETFKDAPMLLARAVEAAHKERPQLPVRKLLLGAGVWAGLALIVLAVIYLPGLLSTSARRSPEPTGFQAAGILSSLTQSSSLTNTTALASRTPAAQPAASATLRSSDFQLTDTPTIAKPTPQPSQTAAQVETATSTPTPSLTSATTPTLDPRIQLAAWGEPMALPETAGEITAENAGQLTELARRVSPNPLTGVAWSAYQGQTSILATGTGSQTTIYYSDGKAPLQIECGFKADTLVFSPGGTQLPCPKGAAFDLYNTKTGKYFTLAKNSNDSPRDSPVDWDYWLNDNLAAVLRNVANQRYKLRQWHLPPTEPSKVFWPASFLDTGNSTSIAFTLDGRYMANGQTDGQIWLWDVTEEGTQINIERITVLPGAHTNPVLRLDYSKNASWLASGSADKIAIWQMPDGVQAFASEELEGTVNSLEISPSGTLLAAAGRFKVVLWSIPDGLSFTVLNDPSISVAGLAWSPDGRYLAVALQDGTLRFLGIRP